MNTFFEVEHCFKMVLVSNDEKGFLNINYFRNVRWANIAFYVPLLTYL